MNKGIVTLADNLAEFPARQANAARSREADLAARDAFDRLIRIHQRSIARLVARLMAWPSDSAPVEDVVQEVFMVAWEKRHQFRGEADASTWLTRIAINKSRNHWRKSVRWKQVLEQFSDFIRSQATGEPSRLRHDQLQDRLHTAIRRLRPTDREIIVLHYLEERPVDEISELLGAKRNTVDARLSRARKRLKSLLESSTRCNTT